MAGQPGGRAGAVKTADPTKTVIRRGRFDYVGDDFNEVGLAQMTEVFDEFFAKVIRNDPDDPGRALRDHGFRHTAEALGL
jgi:hypothetical protein